MTKNIAHRGFSGKYPENTILAFQKALEAGVDGIEFDVHLTRDGKLVIVHDETVDRTSDGAGWVGEMTLKELRALDFSAGFKGKYGAQRIPLLEEYFELIRGQRLLTNIELKTGVVWYEGIEEKVLDVIERYGRTRDVIISSFNHFSAVRFKKLAPEIKCGFLEESRIIGPAGYTAAHGVECYHPFYADMTPDVVAELREKGIEINVWTVNEKQDMLDMLQKGVDGVITNFPDRFGQVREEFERR